jgi:hypothetical protein
MKGHLKSIMLNTSQEIILICVPDVGVNRKYVKDLYAYCSNKMTEGCGS